MNDEARAAVYDAIEAMETQYREELARRRFEVYYIRCLRCAGEANLAALEALGYRLASPGLCDACDEEGWDLYARAVADQLEDDRVKRWWHSLGVGPEVFSGRITHGPGESNVKQVERTKDIHFDPAARIAELEQHYGWTTDGMLERQDKGDLPEDPEIAEWIVLAGGRNWDVD